MSIDDLSFAAERSLSSSEESLSLRCDLLTESLFDEKSLLTFFSDQEQKDFKVRIIRNVLTDRNLDALSALGLSNFGFVTTNFRKESWYLLLTEQLKLDQTGEDHSGDLTKEHVDENQVQLDVKRSFTSLNDPLRKESLRKLLEHTIIKILRKYPKLRYYQGYHDIVSVFIIVFMEGCDYRSNANEDLLSLSDITSKGEDARSYSNSEDANNSTSSASTEIYEGEITDKGSVAEDKLFRCVESFTLLYLRDFMMDSLDFPIDQLKIIPQMIKSKDKRFFKKLQLDKVEPFFAISSILTVFSHELKPSENNSDSQIFQIFDFVISSQSMLVPLIMYSTLIIENKDKVMEEYFSNAENFENTVDLVHGVMQQVLVNASYDEEAWKRILRIIRSRPIKDNATKYRGIVNKYSSLLTTASGPKIRENYSVKHVIDLLEKEIEQNARRRATNAQRKLQSQGVRPLVRLLSYAHNHTISFFCRVSLFIGLMTLLVKLYRDGSIKVFIPSARIYIRKFRSSYIAGIYQGTKAVWLDPLHELLKNSLRSR